MLIQSRRLVAYALAAVVIAAASAQAQKPALTKSIDEPGRSPYSEPVAMVCNFGGSPCIVSFPAVPAGFRLVVTHVSMWFFIEPNTIPRANLAQNTSNDFEYLPAPSALSPLEYVISTPLTYYVEPGSVPEIVVHGAAIGNIVSASMNGYLVAIP